MSLSIIELLQRVGVDKVFVQNLAENCTGAKARKDGTSVVSFVTGAEYCSPSTLLSSHPAYMGIVVWLPYDAALEAKRAAAEAKQEAGS